MPDVQKTVQQLEHRLGEVSREVLRIESHMRRGEFRAARARLSGLKDQVDAMTSDSSTPLQMTIIGAQMGFLSGGNWLRGRLPAALLLGVGGWLFGQSLAHQGVNEVAAIQDHLRALEEELDRSEAGAAATP